MRLEIQGDSENGFHLILAPSGFFAADYWYATLQEAMDAAKSLLGVNYQQWTAIRDGS